MLGLIRDIQARRAARRLERERAEAAFLAECEARVRRWAQELSDAGLAGYTFFDDDGGGGAPPGFDVEPMQPEAVGVWIGLDYPTFELALPKAGYPEGFHHTSELFGSFEQRLAELDRRLAAIAGGRLRWSYRASGVGCMKVTWLDEDGEAFGESHYSGAEQSTEDVAGHAAPY